MTSIRETFASRFGLLMTMIGVAIGLGNVWRFPYMVGRYGGAPFVLVYAAMVLVVGVPALMAEWSLGRMTRRGPVGAFEGAGLPFGRPVGWFFFCVVVAATGYYTNALGWVLFHAVAGLADGFGVGWDASVVLPPESGFAARSFLLQLFCTGLVILACGAVLLKGLRSGIERISKVIVPALATLLLIVIVRSLTLPGAWDGVVWFILKFEAGALSGRVMLAALGQTVFSLALGGTFMVVYGSYLERREALGRNAAWTALSDLGAGLLAGMAIFPAVFALGMEASSGPGLLFETLPRVFARIPAGGLFSMLFFLALFGAAYLSDVAAFEVLVAGLTDNTRIRRTRAVWLVGALVFCVAVPPMINMEVFVPWDLTFGSGMQTLGALLSVVTVAWVVRQADALKELAGEDGSRPPLLLYYWLRFVIPGAIASVGVWWVLTDLLGIVAVE